MNEWRSSQSRFRLLICTHAPWGLRADKPTTSKNMTHTRCFALLLFDGP